MLKTLAYATLFSTALAGSAAFAQQSPGSAANPATPMKQEPMKQDQAKPGQSSVQGAQPDKSQARATDTQAPSGTSFVTTQKETQWRELYRVKPALAKWGGRRREHIVSGRELSAPLRLRHSEKHAVEDCRPQPL